MNIELLKEEMKQAREVISSKESFIRVTRREIAAYICPFSVGERVVSPEGDEQIISSISYRSWGNPLYDFKVFKIKKNGEPYVNSTYAYNLEKYTKALKSPLADSTEEG